jgi:CRP/FNR family transcriptional regulator, anaerobic regulatory protein
MTTLPGATLLQIAEEVNPPDEDGSRTLRVHDQLLLGRRILREKFGNSQRRLVKAGELLGSANGASDGIYHLRSGWACQFRDWFDGRRVIVDVYLPGAVIGLGAGLRVRPMEEVLALNLVVVEEIPAEQALTMMADPATTLYLAWLLSRQHRRAERLLAAVSGIDARGRLATMLLDFYTRLQRSRLITRPTYNLPLTQIQIGQYLGLTVVHINRVLRSLRADRIVSLEKHWVTILDLERLTNLTHYGQKCDLVGKGRESPSDRPVKRPKSGDLIGRAHDRRPSIQAPHGDEAWARPPFR